MESHFFRILSAACTILLFLNGCDSQTVTLTVSTLSIAEDSPVGTTLTTFAATGGTTPYTYAIMGGSTDFEVGSTNTAEFLVKAALDFETTPTYTLTITATDSTSGTALVGSATLTISILANSAPTFSSTSYTFTTLTADAAAGTSIGTVTATDVDTGVNKVASLAIVDGNNFTTFDISNTNGVGEITVGTGKIANLTSYTLTVHAIDGGTPALTATATVSITYPSGAVANYLGLLLLVGAFIMHTVKYI